MTEKNIYQRALWCIDHWIDDYDEELAPQFRQFTTAVLAGAGEELVREVEKHLRLNREFTEKRPDLVMPNYHELQAIVHMAYSLLTRGDD